MAYSVGYVSTTSQRNASTVARQLSKPESLKILVRKIVANLIYGIRLDGFAAVCAITIGGWKLLNQLIQLVGGAGGRGRGTARTSFISAFVSSYAAIKYWHHCQPHKRTLDLTLVAAVRAADMLIERRRRHDIVVFAASCAVIMYCWFYRPERLPSSYNVWITRAADMDTRILEALRAIEKGDLKYGQEKNSRLLEQYALDCGMERKDGNLYETNKIPCRIVHNGVCDNCELHALYRFTRGLKSGLMIYVPINVLLYLVKRMTKKGKKPTIKSSAVSTIRSSMFLASFITTVWYYVCFVRSRVEPMLNQDPSGRDETPGPILGCLLCGWTIIIEKPSRRLEMALYGKKGRGVFFLFFFFFKKKMFLNVFIMSSLNVIVAPKALGTFVPETNTKRAREIESIVFAASTAALITGASRGSNVRGWMGYLLKYLVR